METFFTFLARRVDDCSSLVCVGLDPHISDLRKDGQPSVPTAAAALDFCVNIVQQTARYAAAFKPNAAFFEVFGAEGWAALKQVVEAINDQSNRLGSRIPIILDAKRGDIASTAEAYAKSAFENLGVDCITLNPYLGKDSIEPFLQYPERGVFLLCKTSNAGAGDLQDLIVTIDDGRQTVSEKPSSTPALAPGASVVHGPSSIPLYEYVAYLAQSWNTRNNIGLVVGATYPETLARVRKAAPDLWFLAPGIGTQGGELELVLKAGLRKDGKGMLINVSRSIARAEKPGLAAAELRDEILQIKAKLYKASM